MEKATCRRDIGGGREKGEKQDTRRQETLRSEKRQADPLKCTTCKYFLHYEKGGKLERVCARNGTKFKRVPISHPMWCPLWLEGSDEDIHNLVRRKNHR